MENYNRLEVNIDGEHIGTLAMYQGRFMAFEYTDSWLNNGFSINPFILPLQKKLFIPKYDPFDGVFGVFADSLPDGWGRLLVDRMLIKMQKNLNEVDMLNRLAIVGDSGMGALTYFPQYVRKSVEVKAEYDYIADECKKVLESEYSEDLDKLFLLGGSSGGARPKILTEIDGDDWIIKFPSSTDGKNSGEVEYRYSLCAKKCGIHMTDTQLFSSNQCSGYFGTKRFDRIKQKSGEKKRKHVQSVSALLETSHRIPALDYNSLMLLTLELTRDYSEAEKMFKLMCFNVFAHNRDDHSKNFSFLFNDITRKWETAPAYDLTYSNSIGGEHATCINGNGRDPTIVDLLAVAENINLDMKKAKITAEHIQHIVQEELSDIL